MVNQSGNDFPAWLTLLVNVTAAPVGAELSDVFNVVILGLSAAMALPFSVDVTMTLSPLAVKV